MDRYQFEDNISNYIENSLTQQKRKEFEQYMEEHPGSAELVEDIRTTIYSMQAIPEVNTSPGFMNRLNRRLELEKNHSSRKVIPQNTIFGFTPLYAGLMSIVVLGLIFVGLTMIPNSNPSNGVMPPQFTEKSEITPGTINPSGDYMVEVEEDSLDQNNVDPKQTNRTFDNRIHLVKDSNPSFK